MFSINRIKCSIMILSIHAGVFAQEQTLKETPFNNFVGIYKIKSNNSENCTWTGFNEKTLNSTSNSEMHKFYARALNATNIRINRIFKEPSVVLFFIVHTEDSNEVIHSTQNDAIKKNKTIVTKKDPEITSVTSIKYFNKDESTMEEPNVKESYFSEKYFLEFGKNKNNEFIATVGSGTNKHKSNGKITASFSYECKYVLEKQK